MQPIIKDPHGVVRFKTNAVVRRLLDESQERGYGLNQLPYHEFSQADREQFFQLIGYSLAGYHELSHVSDASCFEASKVARAKFDDPAIGGCRDHWCQIHCGVKQEPWPHEHGEDGRSAAMGGRGGRGGRVTFKFSTDPEEPDSK